MALTQITTDGIKDGTISSADLSDQSVTLTKLPHGTSSNDGKFLRANNGADPTFETVTGTTINSNADNRIITGSGTAATLNGESDLTFDGTNLLLNGKILKFANVSTTPSASGNVHIYAHETKLKMCGGSGIQFEEGGFTRWHITNGALHPHGTTYNNLGNSSNRVGNAYIQTSVDLVDNAKALFGTGDDLQIYHDGSNSYLDNTTGNFEIRSNEFRVKSLTSTEPMIHATKDAEVRLYYDNGIRLQTEAWGTRIMTTGQDAILSIQAEDNRSAEMRLLADNGDNNADYTKFRKDKDTGKFHIQNLGSGTWEDNIVCINQGAVDLYYNNLLRLQTKTDGTATLGESQYTTHYMRNSSDQTAGRVQGWRSGDVCEIGFSRPDNNSWFIRCDKNVSSGLQVEYHWQNVLPSVNNSYDLGSTTYRWRNIYTNDLNLSNEGGANDVDMTWGNFTIQEGHHDLFLINKRTGKKFKFLLEEIS